MSVCAKGGLETSTAAYGAVAISACGPRPSGAGSRARDLLCAALDHATPVEPERAPGRRAFFFLQLY